jgi:hypothetical protein
MNAALEQMAKGFNGVVNSLSSKEIPEPTTPELDAAKDALKDTNTDLAVAQSELEIALEAQKNLPNDASDDEKKTAQERVTVAQKTVDELSKPTESETAITGGRRRSRRRNNKKSAKRGDRKSAKKGGKKHRKSAKKGGKKRSYRKH